MGIRGGIGYNGELRERREMKAAIVGLGAIGKVHAEILQDQKRCIGAVCDVDESRLARYSGCAHYTEYSDMLDEAKPDVVHICTPHYLHAEMIIEALKRNINVLCEKPLCICRKDISRILDAEKRSDAQLGVCHQNRYNEANVFVKEYIRNKKISSGNGVVVWNRNATYYDSAAWRGKWKTEGGGVLINQALHTLDLLEWFVGNPEFVAADISNLTLSEHIEVEDTAAAIFSGGANFSLFATNGGFNDFPVEITLQTEEETIKTFSETVLINGKKQAFTNDGRVYAKDCYGSGHEKLIADFYNCIKTGKKFPIDGKEAAKVISLILACYESGGKKIRI